ncbi:GxxExxY protein [Candidatus Wolfebacteria bacterium CG10_big_fil_rev_8_21_14_0_10_31_9]|uniref:GxxExxY protein n=1 Tax=Candidatus Wolfebacteria bacterium CG10_big_fil_rev_8_21_14_0_10_31_9 TaxID=1975070 RepID=A0A2H0RCJ3_9BACT|nr:MAG: GxxExxY protein [Candidatus Wolfebacteria bacterium CG10_big_fil_rev_8_21_14_0_10_31_9]
MIKNSNEEKVIYPQLSYKIVGALFEVYNSLGYGYKEKYYQRALSEALKGLGIKFKEQLLSTVKFKNNDIGKIFLDFLIDDKIVLEIKKTDRFSKTEIEQVLGYLKATNLKLGIIAHFTKDGIKYKRILNIN